MVLITSPQSSDIVGPELDGITWDNIDLNEDQKESTVDLDLDKGGVVAVSTAAGKKDQVSVLTEGEIPPGFGLAVLALFDYSSGWADTWVDPKKGAGADVQGDARVEESTSESICETVVMDLIEEVLTAQDKKNSTKKSHRHSCLDFPTETSRTMAVSCFFLCKRIRSMLQSISISRSYKKELNKKSKRKQIQEWKKRKMEKKQKEYTEIWLTKILPNWYNLKDDPWVKLSWRQGLPPAVRGFVWPLALGNSLRITEELYNYYTSQASLEIDQDKMISSMCFASS